MIESKKLRAKGGVCKSERMIVRLRTSCIYAESAAWAKSRRLRAKRSIAERLRLKWRVPGEGS